MNRLHKRIEVLESKPRITVPEPPPETEEARVAREAFEHSCAALRERCGGRDELAEGVANDPVARRLAKEAREKFRAYIRTTRGGSDEQH
jgi:hypothetical protein